MNLIYKIAVILIIGGVSCKEKVKNQPGILNQSDSETNKVKLTDLNNKTIDLGQYRGKTLFINFWATWCKPCMGEMSSIEKAQSILQKKEVIFLLASSEAIEEIKEFKNDHDYKFNYVRVENIEALNIQALPTTFIFNPEGSLIFSEMGARNWADSSNVNMILKILK